MKQWYLECGFMPTTSTIKFNLEEQYDSLKQCSMVHYDSLKQCSMVHLENKMNIY